MEVLGESSDTKLFSVMAFTVVNRPIFGTLTFIRVYSDVMHIPHSPRQVCLAPYDVLNGTVHVHDLIRNQLCKAAPPCCMLGYVPGADRHCLAL